MKICKYCGAINTLDATKCSECSANDFSYKCENCGTEFDDGMFCPKCGVKVSDAEKTCPKCGKKYFSNACPNCGYVDETLINDSISVDDNVEPPKKKKTWLWVLGWIFIFPIPLTILMLRNKKLNKIMKAIIIILAWSIYLVIGLAGGDDTTTSMEDEIESTTAVVNQSSNAKEKTTEETEKTEEASNDPIDSFVDEFNKVDSTIQLTYVEDFTVQDKSSGHYRTEFRTTGFLDATAKSYKYNDCIVDIIAFNKVISDEQEIRIYFKDISIEDAVVMLNIVLPIMDEDLTEEEIQKTVTDLQEKKELNGYYCGKISILYLRNELMISDR